MSFLASLGLLGLGVILLGTFIALHWLRILPTVAAAFAFLAPVLIGDNGVIGRMMIHLIKDLVIWTGDLTAWAFGTSAVVLVTIICGIVFVHDLHPKHTTGRRTAWLGLALGLLVVAGATGIAGLSGAAGGIQHGTTGVVSQF